MPEYIMNNLPSVVLVFVAALIGAVAYRHNNTKQLRELQEKAVATYKTLNEAQDEEIKRLRKENMAMRAAFRHLGVAIEIDGNEVILIDEQKPKRTRLMTVNIEEEVKNGLKEKED